VDKPRKWRWGVNRWIILAVVVAGFFMARIYPPVLPHIQLPAEPLTKEPLFTLPVIGPFFFTNTMLAIILVDIILIAIALLVRRAATSGDLVPKGLSGAIEAVIEAIYNLTESTAGKWTSTIFPFFATITLLVLVANWMELIPGVDSIGILEKAPQGEQGYPVHQIAPGIGTIVKSSIKSPASTNDSGENMILVPFVRVVSTDLNFTVALALISVTMVQVIGVRARGLSYFTKYINVKTLFSKPFFGAIDFAVGLLEIVSEISKILSFSFRLFGNIFAGSVLLFVIGYLVPIFAQSIFFLLEFGVGLIQAIVFGMLTMVFMAQATMGHGDNQPEHT